MFRPATSRWIDTYKRYILIRKDDYKRELFRGTPSEILEKLLQNHRTAESALSRPFEVREEHEWFPPRTPSYSRQERFGDIAPFFLLSDAMAELDRLQSEFPELGLDRSDAYLHGLVSICKEQLDLIPEPPMTEMPPDILWIYDRALLVGPHPLARDLRETSLRVGELRNFGVTSFLSADDRHEHVPWPPTLAPSDAKPDLFFQRVADSARHLLPYRLHELLAHDEVVYLGVRGSPEPTANLLGGLFEAVGKDRSYGFAIMFERWAEASSRSQRLDFDPS